MMHRHMNKPPLKAPVHSRFNKLGYDVRTEANTLARALHMGVSSLIRSRRSSYLQR